MKQDGIGNPVLFFWGAPFMGWLCQGAKTLKLLLPNGA